MAASQVFISTSWIVSCFLITAVYGSGCHHQCDCGFKWSSDDVLEEKTTLRYEVIGGLCGGFAPLLIAGICYLLYKKCCSCGPWRKPYGWGPFQDSMWARGRLTPPGGFNRPRGSTPISLYRETEDSFTAGNPSLMNKGSNPTAPAIKPENMTVSRYTNVHRNHPGNEINQWFKNVNTIEYKF